MSTNQLLPVWLTVGATQTVQGAPIRAYSMAADIASDPVTLTFEDNTDIQCKWTGTPTGVLAVQISLDPTNLGWQTVSFGPAPDQPAGSASGNYFSINQTGTAFIRLIYTRTSGTGTLSAKISAKSV